MNYLQYIDSDSTNVEMLRKSRTFNDLTSILSSIKSSITQIHSRLYKRLSSASKQEITVGATGSSGNFSKLTSVYEDLHTLRCFSLELEFAKSIAFNIPNESKKARFDVLSSRLANQCVDSINLAYKYLDSVGSKQEPKDLLVYANSVKKLLGSSIKYSKVQSFVLPSSDKNPSFSHYLVFYNVKTSSGFIVPNVLVSINAINNFNGSHYFTVSFPSEINSNTTNSIPFSSNKVLLDEVSKKFSVVLGHTVQPGLSPIKEGPILRIPNVFSAKLEGHTLSVELDSGVTASEINAVLTALLPMIHAMTGLSKVKTDILHRVSTTDSGTKKIEFTLRGRTLADRKPLSNLKKMLPLSKGDIDSIISLLGN